MFIYIYIYIQGESNGDSFLKSSRTLREDTLLITGQTDKDRQEEVPSATAASRSSQQHAPPQPMCSSAGPNRERRTQADSTTDIEPGTTKHTNLPPTQKKNMTGTDIYEGAYTKKFYLLS